MRVCWPFPREQSGEHDPTSSPAAGWECRAGREPSSHPHDTTPLGFLPFFSRFCCLTCKERRFWSASWFDTAEVFWKKRAFFYTAGYWESWSKILGYRRTSRKTAVTAIPQWSNFIVLIARVHFKLAAMAVLCRQARKWDDFTMQVSNEHPQWLYKPSKSPGHKFLFVLLLFQSFISPLNATKGARGA